MRALPAVPAGFIIQTYRSPCIFEKIDLGSAPGVPMQQENFFEEGELFPEEPSVWKPPVPCPRCGLNDTRFLTLTYEVSVYICDVCSTRFEIDEGEEA